MGSKRENSTIAGLSGSARRVYEVAPISEAWTLHQFASELRRVGGPIETDRVQGCINHLRGVGLLREVKAGHWQRVEIEVSEKPRAAPPGAPLAATASPLDALGELGITAAQIRTFGEALQRAAERIEEMALVMAKAQEHNAAAAAQFQKLRELLQGGA